MGKSVLVTNHFLVEQHAEHFRNADSVVQLKDGSLVFVEPEETHEDFVTFLEYVTEDARSRGNNEGTRPVRYAQTRKLNQIVSSSPYSSPARKRQSTQRVQQSVRRCAL